MLNTFGPEHWLKLACVSSHCWFVIRTITYFAIPENKSIAKLKFICKKYCLTAFTIYRVCFRRRVVSDKMKQSNLESDHRIAIYQVVNMEF